MELKSINFTNYKAFSNEESIEIRPITILIGKNSSGKSAIARLLMLMSKGFSEAAESPITFDPEGIDIGAETSDLIYNKILYGKIGLGATIIYDGNKEGNCSGCWSGSEDRLSSESA